MEQGNKKLRIATNHIELLKSSINKFNSVYKTDLILLDYVKDEVNFAIVGYDKTTDNQLFDFGYQYGGLIMHLRIKGEISD